MKKYTFLSMSVLLLLSINAKSQIGEFEGDVKISDGTASLEFFDTGDNRRKGMLREQLSIFYLESHRGDLRFGSGTNGSALTRMTIDGATGDIGIGTTGPTAQFDVRHNSTLSSAHLEIDETTADDYARIKFINSGSSGDDFWDVAGRANGSVALASNTATSRFNFYYKDKGTGPGYDYLSIRPINLFGEYLASFNFRGNLIPVKDDLYTIGTGALRWSAVYAESGTIQTSDVRMKKNIESLPYGLEDLLRLKPVTYQWKNKQNPKQQLGLIAQEVLTVIPEAVYATETIINDKTGETEQKAAETMGMNYSTLIPVLIKSIQEQQAMIDRLSSQNEQLHSRVTALEE